MAIDRVSYGFTFNIGNYQSERFDCEVRLEEGETPEQAIEQAKHFVAAAHATAEAQRQRADEVVSARRQMNSLRRVITDEREQLVRLKGPEVEGTPLYVGSTDDLEGMTAHIEALRAERDAVRAAIELARRGEDLDGPQPPF
jgi:hypothetical protein